MITVLGTNAYNAARKVKQPKHKTLPVLNTIHLYESNGRLAMTVLDMNTIDSVWEAITEYVPARVNEPFDTCVPAKPFIDWLKVTAVKIPKNAIGRGLSDQIELTFIPERLTLQIKAGTSKAEFKCIDSREYPHH